MLRFGAKANALGRVFHLSREQIITFESVQIILGILLFFLGAKFIQWVSAGFHFERSYRQCFTLTVFGITPIFWWRLADGFPLAPSWGCWAMAALWILFMFYHGVAEIFKPDTSLGFGLYLLASLSIIGLTGLAHLLAQIVLDRQFSVMTWLSSGV